MKRLILLLLTGMVFLSLFAEEKSIELKKVVYGVERRSLTFPPTVTYDDNILHIYSNVCLNIQQITITHLDTGNSFSNNSITIFPNQPYTIFLDNANNGTYKIELKMEQTIYYGFLIYK